MKHTYNKDKKRSIVLKESQKVLFHKIQETPKKASNWLHIWGVMIIFLF